MDSSGTSPDHGVGVTGVGVPSPSYYTPKKNNDQETSSSNEPSSSTSNEPSSSNEEEEETREEDEDYPDPDVSDGEIEVIDLTQSHESSPIRSLPPHAGIIVMLEETDQMDSITAEHFHLGTEVEIEMQAEMGPDEIPVDEIVEVGDSYSEEIEIEGYQNEDTTFNENEVEVDTSSREEGLSPSSNQHQLSKLHRLVSSHGIAYIMKSPLFNSEKYLDCIKNRVDFPTITKRIQCGRIKTFEDYQVQITHSFLNVLMYYPEDHRKSIEIRQLSDEIMPLIEIFIRNYKAREESRPTVGENEHGITQSRKPQDAMDEMDESDTEGIRKSNSKIQAGNLILKDANENSIVRQAKLSSETPTFPGDALEFSRRERKRTSSPDIAESWK